MTIVDPLTKISFVMSNPALSNKDKLIQVARMTLDLQPRANRISFWRFLPNLSAIECLYGLDDASQSEFRGVILKQQDFPTYFVSILNDNVVQADDACHHPSTVCFRDSYFKQNNIYSLLDYILVESAEPIGVICCESVGKQVVWQAEDVANLKAIARKVALFFNRSS